MLNLAGLLPRIAWSSLVARLLMLGGITTFVLIAGLTHWFGTGWLNYPAPWSKSLIMLIEIAATLSIAAILTVLVIGERERPGL